MDEKIITNEGTVVLTKTYDEGGSTFFHHGVAEQKPD